MANNINWGKIYCTTNWGDTVTTTTAIPDFSAPACWASLLGISTDDTNIRVDSNLFTADTT